MVSPGGAAQADVTKRAAAKCCDTVNLSREIYLNISASHLESRRQIRINFVSN